MSAEKLAAILEKGDTKACMKFFRDMPEKERVAYAKQARDCLDKAYKESWKTSKVGEFQHMTFTESEQRPAASVAFLFTTSFGNLKKLHLNMARLDNEIVHEILTSRKPDWLVEWANWNLEDDTFYEWSLIRRLV